MTLLASLRWTVPNMIQTGQLTIRILGCGSLSATLRALRLLRLDLCGLGLDELLRLLPLVLRADQLEQGRKLRRAEPFER